MSERPKYIRCIASDNIYPLYHGAVYEVVDRKGQGVWVWVEGDGEEIFLKPGQYEWVSDTDDATYLCYRCGVRTDDGTPVEPHPGGVGVAVLCEDCDTPTDANRIFELARDYETARTEMVEWRARMHRCKRELEALGVDVEEVER